MWKFVNQNDYNQYTFWGIIVYAIIIIVIALLTKRINRNLFNTIPSFSASVGVFFTFWVLYAKLKNFDIPDDKDILKNLINQLSAAFSTSIIGLAGSLISNLFIKLFLPVWEGKKHQGKPHLNEHPNQLLYDLLQTNKQVIVAIEQQKSTEQLDLLAKIEKHTGNIQTHIGTELKYLFEGLSTQFESIISKIGVEALNSTKETVTALNKNFSEETAILLQRNLKAIADFFENNQKFLEQTANQFSQQGNNITTGLDAVTVEVENKMDEVKNSFKSQIEAMATNYADNAGKLDHTFNEIHLSLKGLTERIQDSVQTVVENNITSLEKSFERIEQYQLTAQNKLEQTTKDFASAVNHYTETNDHQEEILASVAQLLEAYEPLRNKLDELMYNWDTYAGEIKKQEHRITDIANTIAQLDNIHQYLQTGNR